jgi:response regulator of citrate/malate metabolism
MRRILIVEDDHSCGALLRNMVHLIDGKASVDCVEDAEKATLLLAQENSAGRKYDLILADIYLAGKLTGVDMWGLHDEFFPDTPVIFTSSISESKFLAVIGPDAVPPPFLHKPLELIECQSMLREFLR